MIFSLQARVQLVALPTIFLAGLSATAHAGGCPPRGFGQPYRVVSSPMIVRGSSSPGVVTSQSVASANAAPGIVTSQATKPVSQQPARQQPAAGTVRSEDETARQESAKAPSEQEPVLEGPVAQLPIVETNVEVEATVAFALDQPGHVSMRVGGVQVALKITDWSPDRVRFRTPDLNLEKPVETEIKIFRPDGHLVRSFSAVLRSPSFLRVIQTVSTNEHSNVAESTR